MKRVILLTLCLLSEAASAQHHAAYEALDAFTAQDGDGRQLYVELRKEVACPISIDGRSIESWCYEAYGRGSEDAQSSIAPEEARTFMRAGEALVVRVIERPDALRRREEMLAQNAEAKIVPRPSFPCAKANELRARVCNSYLLTRLENEYVALEEKARLAMANRDWLGAQQRQEVDHRRAFEARLVACKSNQTCLEDVFFSEIGHQLEILKQRGVSAELTVSRAKPAAKMAAPDPVEPAPPEQSAQ
jgi:hypothetical protein